MADLVETVAQCDRDRAVAYWKTQCIGTSVTYRQVREGMRDQSSDLVQAFAAHRIAAEAALQVENEKLREALREIEEGRIARPLGSAYRADGVASRHDLCIHNVYMYQTCGSCIDAHIQAALEPKP